MSKKKRKINFNNKLLEWFPKSVGLKNETVKRNREIDNKLPTPSGNNDWRRLLQLWKKKSK